MRLLLVPQLTLAIWAWVCLTLGGCAENNGKATVNKDTVAGKVVGLTGQVEASRSGQKSRALNVADSIFGDDTITTKENSTVEIALVHNGAQWRLEPEQEKRVDQSLAWRAKARESGLLDRKERLVSGSAGTHQEKSAAEDVSTVKERDVAAESVRDALESEGAPKAKSAPKARKRNSKQPSVQPSPGRLGAGGGSEKGGGGGRTSKTGMTGGLVADPVPPPPAAGAEAPRMDAEESQGDSLKAPTRSAPYGLVNRLGKQCTKKQSGGKLAYKLVIKDGKFVSISSSTKDKQVKLLGCLRKKLQETDLTEFGSGSGTYSW